MKHYELWTTLLGLDSGERALNGFLAQDGVYLEVDGRWIHVTAVDVSVDALPEVSDGD
jgi:hypothetical protein